MPVSKPSGSAASQIETAAHSRFRSPAVPHPDGFAARLTAQPWAQAPEGATQPTEAERSGTLGSLRRPTLGELVHGVCRSDRVELDEVVLDLAKNLADRDTKDTLAAAHEVDDLVV